MCAANVLTIRKWTLFMTIRVLYNMKKSFRMAPRVQDKVDIPVFSPAERMFLCNLKIAGESYSSICIKFTEKYEKSPPPGRVCSTWLPSWTDPAWWGGLPVLLSEFDADTRVTFTGNLQIAQKHSLSRREHWNVNLILHPWGHSETFFHFIKNPGSHK